MKMLNHTYIDVLKMDIEDGEWDFIQYESDLFSRIGQYLVEVHIYNKALLRHNIAISDLSHKYKHTGYIGHFISKLEENNMRLFHRETNFLYGPHCCAEFSLIRTNWSIWNNKQKYRLLPL